LNPIHLHLLLFDVRDFPNVTGGRPPKIYAKNFVGLRLPDALAAAIDAWAAAQ
jgi:hypothetical protein